MVTSQSQQSTPRNTLDLARTAFRLMRSSSIGTVIFTTGQSTQLAHSICFVLRQLLFIAVACVTLCALFYCRYFSKTAAKKDKLEEDRESEGSAVSDTEFDEYLGMCLPREPNLRIYRFICCMVLNSIFLWQYTKLINLP